MGIKERKRRASRTTAGKEYTIEFTTDVHGRVLKRPTYFKPEKKYVDAVINAMGLRHVIASKGKKTTVAIPASLLQKGRAISVLPELRNRTGTKRARQITRSRAS
ncbi:MAG: hypothetical protein HZA15_11655 [Nitrospirae bacterium]|nr:hypothetical protein [Nitrospirota bacterium]